MRLTAVERETIVNFNQAEDIAYIYTCDPKWWRHFDRLGVKPTQAHKGATGAVYARDYEVPKKWVKPPKPPGQLDGALGHLESGLRCGAVPHIRIQGHSVGPRPTAKHYVL